MRRAIQNGYKITHFAVVGDHGIDNCRMSTCYLNEEDESKWIIYKLEKCGVCLARCLWLCRIRLMLAKTMSTGKKAPSYAPRSTESDEASMRTENKKLFKMDVK